MSRILILLVLMTAWFSGSTYWYVCKIQDLCLAAPVQAKPNSAQTTLNQKPKLPPKFGKTITITFGPDSSEYIASPSSESDLIQVARYGVEHETIKVLVVGYTANLDSGTDQDALSLARAASIKQRLIDLGVEPEQIETSSKGTTQQIGDSSTEESATLNRRATVSFKE